MGIATSGARTASRSGTRLLYSAQDLCLFRGDATRGWTSGVAVIDIETGEDLVFHARVVFLCALSMNTMRIMLLSISDRFPEGIGNDNGTLGRYLMDHHHVGVNAEFDGYEDCYYRGERPGGVYILRFGNVSSATWHPDVVRGYAFQGSASRHGWQCGYSVAGFGAQFKHRLRTLGRWWIGLGGFGETLPHYDNYCELDDTLTDAYGIPALRFHVMRDTNDRAMRKDMMAAVAEMLEAAGTATVEPYDHAQDAPDLGNHEMGLHAWGTILKQVYSMLFINTMRYRTFLSPTGPV